MTGDLGARRQSRMRSALAAAAVWAGLAGSAAADYDGPGALYTPAGAYVSPLYFERTSSNDRYVAYGSKNRSIWVFLDPGFRNAAGGSAPSRATG